MSKITPIVSIIAPAIYTEHWQRFYDHASQCNVPFEIVFVGDIKPDFTLPPNFRHVYSAVKPSQCAEIASRLAVGKYVMLVADDQILLPNALDWLCDYAERLRDERMMVGCQFESGGRVRAAYYYSFGKLKMKTPIVIPGALLSKKVWHKLGGIDRRFIGVFGDNDMQLRFYEVGGRPFIVPQATLSEPSKQRKGLHKQFRADRLFLRSLWIKDGEFSPKRLKPVESFADGSILDITQGPKGRW